MLVFNSRQTPVKTDIELDSAQSKILDADLTQDWLITGGPGTGKTVLAIRMAEKLSNDGKLVLVLMYNRPLMMYVSHKIQDISANPNYEIKTYYKWLHDVYKRVFGTWCPRTNNVFAWDQICKDMKRAKQLYHTVIIDEAQDFPLPLIRALRSVSNNMICLFNQNQAIKEDGASAMSLLDLGLSPISVQLTINYRNTKEINEAAQIFSNSREHVLGARKGTYPQVYECTTYPDRFYEQYERISEIVRGNEDRTIGIIVNSKSVNTIYGELKQRFANQIIVQKYKPYPDGGNLTFTEPGIKVLSYGTMKGLEFDIVILPFFDRVRSTGDEARDRNRLYVAFTRANEQMHIIYSDDWNHHKEWMPTIPTIQKNSVMFDWH